MAAAKEPAVYSEMLQNRCVSHWLSNTEGISADEETMKLVDEMEALSANEPEVACYWFGNSFASKRQLSICRKQVSGLDELIRALFTVPSDFYQTDGYSKLLSRVDGADLYGFLYSYGYKEMIEKEWEHLSSCDTFDKVTILLSMLDSIAVNEGVDPTPIRNFFIQYGPAGAAAYTKTLVEKQDDRVYSALDSDGKMALSRIAEFRAPKTGSVDELYRAYIPLIENVEKLRRNLIENPHCILTGVYENKGVICTNLVGCFAFKIFDRMAPLGFHAWIEAANGGASK